MSSNGRPPSPNPPNPPPASRDLTRVMRRQVGAAGASGALQLIVGEALDSTGQDGSYTNVLIAGNTYVVPKLRGAAYVIPAGRSVYILADSDFHFMIALGYVSG